MAHASGPKQTSVFCPGFRSSASRAPDPSCWPVAVSLAPANARSRDSRTLMLKCVTTIISVNYVYQLGIPDVVLEGQDRSVCFG